MLVCFFFQAEDGIRDLVRSRGLGDVYKRQKFLCPYCSRAKALLDRKGAAYQEIDVTMDRAGFDLSLIHI